MAGGGTDIPTSAPSGWRPRLHLRDGKGLGELMTIEWVTALVGLALGGVLGYSIGVWWARRADRALEAYYTEHARRKLDGPK